MGEILEEEKKFQAPDNSDELGVIVINHHFDLRKNQSMGRLDEYIQADEREHEDRGLLTPISARIIQSSS